MTTNLAGFFFFFFFFEEWPAECSVTGGRVTVQHIRDGKITNASAPAAPVVESARMRLPAAGG